MAQYAETTATARRRRRPPPAAVALAAVGALGAAAVLTGVVELPDFADALEGLTASLGAWTYLLVPALAFLETGAFVGLLVPGETAVLVGGVVAERGGVALVPLIGLVWLGAFGGDAVSFLIGRRLGRPFLERHGRRLGIGEAQLLRVERFFAAMHLVDTPVSGIAEALRITPRDVRLRIEAMLGRLVPPAPASRQPM